MNTSSAAHPLLPILLPLLSAIVYVTGALLLKRAAELGTGAWRIAALCNFITSLAFAPFALLGGTIQPWQQFWQPALVALLFVVGQFTAFLSLKVGDVSIATPVLGIKIIIVALLATFLLREPVEPSLWIAALLSTAAVIMLNSSGGKPHARVGTTILLASLAAFAFALFDILVQKWSPVWGMGRFLPLMMLFVALYSVPMLWLDRPNPNSPSSRALPWLLGGAITLAMQGLMFISSVAWFGEATMANVLYSSRGLWSVLAVWLIGHWFHNREQHLGRRVLIWRLFGAALMMAAVLLALFSQ